MTLKYEIDLKPGEDAGEKIDDVLTAISIPDKPISRMDLKNALKHAMSSELAKPGATRESIVEVLKGVAREKNLALPGTTQEEQFEKEMGPIADALLQVKKTKGADRAIELFNSGVDKTADSTPLPVGSITGGAVGLAAAAAIDVGDWSSFSGIVKKLAIVGAGVLAGGLIGGDFKDELSSLQTSAPSSPSASPPPTPPSPATKGR